MYGEYDKSHGAKAALTSIHALAVCLSGWILFGDGFKVLFGWTHSFPADDFVLSRALVFVCAVVYFLRICFGSLLWFQRKMTYGEAIGVGVYIAIIDTLFAYFGQTHARQIGWITVLGIALYLIGSYFNSVSELLRYRWKKIPDHRGHLYTGGLFHYSRHINYFGDELLFTGYAVIAGSVWGLIVPAFMACGFIFANIPMLDAHLRKKYGAEFETYATHTKKFVPYVY